MAAFNPVYLYLLSERPPLYPGAPTAVGWELGGDLDRTLATVYLAGARHADVDRWCRSLLRGVARDRVEIPESRFSPLSGDPLRAAARRRLGQRTIRHEREDVPQRVVNPANCATEEAAYVAFVVDCHGVVCGFVGFSIEWYADATQGGADHGRTEMQVELDQAWIRPSKRRVGLSTLLYWAVAEAVSASLQAVDENAPWKGSQKLTVLPTVGASIHSESGGSFFYGCSEEIIEAAELAALKHLRLKRWEIEDRW
jgi:hypothetical protein